MKDVPEAWREFVHQACGEVFLETPSLIDVQGEKLTRRSAPRSTERAIAGRLMVHASPHVVKAFDPDAVIDFEYERVGNGRDAKMRGPAKISPDLVVHRRSDPKGNFLAVEVKLKGRVRARAWRGGPARDDFVKMHFLTHHLEQAYPPDMKSYDWALCAEVDTACVDLWWIPRGGMERGCEPLEFNCDYESNPACPDLAVHERWNAPRENDSPRTR